MSFSTFTLGPDYAGPIQSLATRLDHSPVSVVSALLGFALAKIDEGKVEFFDIDKNEVVEGRGKP